MSVKKLWEKILPDKNPYKPVESVYESEQERCVEEAKNVEQKKITSFNAFWNVSNSIQGVAILAMPYVIKGGGWWSVVAIILVAILSNYTGQILINCHYDDVIDEVTGETVSVRTRSSYAEVGDAMWPVYGKNIVLFIQVLELLFMATLYPIVFVSVTHTLFPHFGLSSGVWVLIFGMLMLPNIFLRRLYHISIMSSLTVASATSVFFAVCVYCLTEIDAWDVHNLEKFSIKEFVASTGVVVASYSSQMYLSVIESDMRNPSTIGTVMNAGYFAMTILKVGVGVIAYMTFGDATSQVVTLNLPAGILLTAINSIVLLLAMSSYTLPMFTVFEILEKDSKWLIVGNSSELGNDKESQKYEERLINVRRTAIRLALMFITLTMAISVPHFCMVLSFIGSFTGAFLEMVFPCWFYLALKHKTLSKSTIIVNVLIITLSLLFMGIGMYSSAFDMIKAFKLHTKEVWTID